MRRCVLALVLGVSVLVAARENPARAEVGEVSIAQQFGAIYLPMMVMESQQLVEKHLAAAGLKDSKVRWSKFSGPAVIVDAFLSGNVHFGAQGPPSLMLLWDRTKGGLGVMGVSALCDANIWMNTRHKDIKSVKDIAEKDRIALPSAKTSGAAIFMGMAAEQAWGPGQHARLDAQVVAMAHPDAVAAVLSANHEVAYHWATSPFHEAEMKAGLATVTSGYEVMGGQTTLIALTSTTRFRAENPKTYAAVVAAADEARDWINADKRRAAALYLELTKDKRVSADDIHALMTTPGFEYGKTPRRISPQADYMHRIGLIKTKPASWKDLFFPEAHGLAGD